MLSIGDGRKKIVEKIHPLSLPEREQAIESADKKPEKTFTALVSFASGMLKDVCLHPAALLFSQALQQSAWSEISQKDENSFEISQMVLEVKKRAVHKASVLQERKEQVMEHLNILKQDFKSAYQELQEQATPSERPATVTHLFHTFTYTFSGSAIEKQNFVWQTIKIAFSLQGISLFFRQNPGLLEDFMVTDLLNEVEAWQQKLIELRRLLYTKYVRELNRVDFMAEARRQVRCRLSQKEALACSLESLSQKELFFLLESLCKPFHLDYENVELEVLKSAVCEK